MNKILFTVASTCMTCMLWADVSVGNVIVRQQWPWSAKVNIDYVLSDPTGGEHDLKLELKNGTTVITPKAGSLSGDLSAVKPGARRIVWDPTVGAGAEDSAVLTDFTATVTSEDDGDTYMIIDVTQKDGNGKYPVTYTSVVPEGGWNQDLYKTDRIVLRRIPAGTSQQGSPENEIGRNQYREILHQTTISKPFYLGIFEMTQKQYEHLTGVSATSDKRPVAQVSYQDLRGVGAVVYGQQSQYWPNYAPDGFFDKLNKQFSFSGKMEGYVFDLPSAAQWEHACRAGTTTTWYDGTDITAADDDQNLDRLAYYWGNASARLHDVGEKGVPNSYGLYDMLGNAGEVVIDYVHGGAGAEFYDGNPVVDPVLYEPTSWPLTVFKGGNSFYGASGCRPANYLTFGAVDNDTEIAVGFRLALYRR